MNRPLTLLYPIECPDTGAESSQDVPVDDERTTADANTVADPHVAQDALQRPQRKAAQVARQRLQHLLTDHRA